MSAHPPTPRPVAMLLCDRIWRDPQSGKWTLLGVFDRVYAGTVPVDRIDIECYAALVGLAGTYDFELAVEDVSGREIARYALGERIRAAQPEERLQIGFNVARLGLPAFGRYTLRLLANGQAVAETPLLVLAEGSDA